MVIYVLVEMIDVLVEVLVVYLGLEVIVVVHHHPTLDLW
jgi:proteasome lid subunit RPN8/RPN11